MKNIERIVAEYNVMDHESKMAVFMAIMPWGKLNPEIIDIISAYIVMDHQSRDFALMAFMALAKSDLPIHTLPAPVNKLFLVTNIGK